MTIRCWGSGGEPGEPERDASPHAGGGVVSLEVRWIHLGRLPTSLAERLGPFREALEVREDCYLTDPALPNLSVKIRGGAEFDVKVFLHSPGRLSLPGGTRGRLEMWEKWSFPLAGGPRRLPVGGSWTRVEKVRRRRSFALADGALAERPLADAALPGCSLELTEVTIAGDVWWTIGLEAVGPLDTQHRDLQATATALIDAQLSTRFELDFPASMSYHDRLRAGTRAADA